MIVRNGDVELHVAEDGDPSAPPILLLHGITSSGRTWDWLVPDLAEHLRVLRLDFRGHGLSARASGEYMPHDYVGDAVAALEQAAGRPCVVVGHSLGGVTAAALAQRHPDLILGAVMEDPPLGPTGPTNRASLADSSLVGLFGMLRRSIPRLQADGVAPDVLAGLLTGAPSSSGATFGELLCADGVESMASAMLEVDATVLDPVVDGTITSFVDPALPFAVPSLILVADPAKPDAAASPRSAAHYASISPDVEVTVVAGAGHLIHDEKASRAVVRDAVLGFLDRVATHA